MPVAGFSLHYIRVVGTSFESEIRVGLKLISTNRILYLLISMVLGGDETSVSVQNRLEFPWSRIDFLSHIQENQVSRVGLGIFRNFVPILSFVLRLGALD
jgi:hypothetical protein